MSLRALFAAIVLVIVAPVYAQQAPSQAHIAAARETLDAMMIRSGALDETINFSYVMTQPLLRQGVTTAPYFSRLSQQQREALENYIQRLPAVGLEEARRGVPAALDRNAPIFAALFTEQELADMRAFAETPDGAAALRLQIAHGARQAFNAQEPPPTFTAEQLAQFEAFSQTAGGRAMDQRGAELSTVFAALGRDLVNPQGMVARLRSDMCTILANECPHEWRPT